MNRSVRFHRTASETLGSTRGALQSSKSSSVLGKSVLGRGRPGFSARAVLSLGALGFGLLGVGCSGSSQKPADTPEDPPLLEPTEENAQAPSSEKVKQGMEAIKAKDFAGAHKVLTEARAEAPEDPQAAYYDGVALDAMGDVDGAVAAYKKAIELHPKAMIEAYQNLSALLQENDQIEEALKVASAGLEVAPKDPALLINKAYAVDLLGSASKPNPEAVLAYEAALAESPDNLNVRYYYAAALGRGGDKAKALAELGKVPLDGKTVPVVEIITVYTQLGAFKECVDSLSSAISQTKSVELLIHRSVCKSQAKDDKGAEADLRDAVATDPSSSVAHYYLARFLDKAGKKAEAKKLLEKANELKAAESKE